jgi:inosine-uridine nucleoside N-ribohydrolase
VPFLIDTIRQNLRVLARADRAVDERGDGAPPGADLVDRLAGISLMGGTTLGGNVTPAAEFNIYVDPEAAAVVFASGIPIKMFGLNVTHEAGAGRRSPRIRAIGTHVAEIVAQLLDFYNGSARRVSGGGRLAA